MKKRQQKHSKVTTSVTWIVDKIEGEVVGVEVGGDSFLNVPRCFFPDQLSEGDVFDVEVEPIGAGGPEAGSPDAGTPDGGSPDAGGLSIRIISNPDRKAELLEKSRRQISAMEVDSDWDKGGDIVL